MRDVDSCPSCPKGLTRALAVVAVVLALGGCGLSGRVYIAFFWVDSEVPDAGFACNAPNVPGLTAIVRGKYYETVPGRYTLSYSYTTSESHSLSFLLKVETTMLGQEHAYYHATLHKLSPPTVQPYP